MMYDRWLWRWVELRVELILIVKIAQLESIVSFVERRDRRLFDILGVLRVGFGLILGGRGGKA